MKNAFYFMLKALFGLEIILFLSRHFCLIRKLRLISKFMTSQTGQQIIKIHTLPNISRSKGNQTMKFGQLIEYNMRTILLEISYAKYGREASPRPFYKKSNLSVSVDQQSEML